MSNDMISVPREILEQFIEASAQNKPGAWIANRNKLLALLAQPNTCTKDGGPVIDLDQESWQNIKQAADESVWIPPEYFMNNWVLDVCRFLRQGPAQAPVMPEKRTNFDYKSLGDDGYIAAKEWNACINEFKRLNPYVEVD